MASVLKRKCYRHSGFLILFIHCTFNHSVIGMEEHLMKSDSITIFIAQPLHWVFMNIITGEVASWGEAAPVFTWQLYSPPLISVRSSNSTMPQHSGQCCMTHMPPYSTLLRERLQCARCEGDRRTYRSRHWTEGSRSWCCVTGVLVYLRERAHPLLVQVFCPLLMQTQLLNPLHMESRLIVVCTARPTSCRNLSPQQKNFPSSKWEVGSNRPD